MNLQIESGFLALSTYTAVEQNGIQQCSSHAVHMSFQEKKFY